MSRGPYPTRQHHYEVRPDLSAFHVPTLLLTVDAYLLLPDRRLLDEWLASHDLVNRHCSALVVLGEGQETRALTCWANAEEKLNDNAMCNAGAWRLIPGRPPPLAGFELIVIPSEAGK